MWCTSSLQVGGHEVQLRVRRLDDDRKNRTAAILAWLTLQAMGDEHVAGAVAWQECVADLLHQHVSLEVRGTRDPENLGSAWWNEAIGRAFIQFVRDNELTPVIQRHLTGMRVVEALGLSEANRGEN